MTSQSQLPPPPRDNGLPLEIMDIIKPSLHVGGLAGFSGLTIGAFGGIMRSSSPTLFALASGVQWFTLGSVYTGSRTLVLEAWGKDTITPGNKISASTIAGGIAGSTGGLLRGPKNILPGAIMFSLLGAAGQKFYNIADARRTERSQLPESEKKGQWLNSPWSPMKVLSDEEYGELLQEKLLRVNAEIALLDESIEALKNEQRQSAKQAGEIDTSGKESSSQGSKGSRVASADSATSTNSQRPATTSTWLGWFGGSSAAATESKTGDKGREQEK